MLYGIQKIDDRVIAGLDNLPNVLLPPSFQPPTLQQIAKQATKFVFATNTITVGPAVTFDDNLQREFIAGNQITFLPGTTIAPAAGGKLIAYTNPCLLTNSLRMIVSNNDSTENKTIEIQDNLIDNYFSLAPNPTTGEFKVILPENLQSNSVLFVYDMMGRTVFQQNIISSQITINLSSQPQGIYSVNVIQGNKIYTDILIHQ